MNAVEHFLHSCSATDPDPEIAIRLAAETAAHRGSAVYVVGSSPGDFRFEHDLGSAVKALESLIDRPGRSATDRELVLRVLPTDYPALSERA